MECALTVNYNYIILVAILTTCLFRQNKFNINFNYHSDADECLNNSHNCTENATCTNPEGSFNCSCKPGCINESCGNSILVPGIPVSLSPSFDTTDLVKKIYIACFFGAEFLKVHLFYHKVNRTWTHLHF